MGQRGGRPLTVNMNAVNNLTTIAMPMKDVAIMGISRQEPNSGHLWLESPVLTWQPLSMCRQNFVKS